MGRIHLIHPFRIFNTYYKNTFSTLISMDVSNSKIVQSSSWGNPSLKIEWDFIKLASSPPLTRKQLFSFFSSFKHDFFFFHTFQLLQKRVWVFTIILICRFLRSGFIYFSFQFVYFYHSFIIFFSFLNILSI